MATNRVLALRRLNTVRRWVRQARRSEDYLYYMAEPNNRISAELMDWRLSTMLMAAETGDIDAEGPHWIESDYAWDIMEFEMSIPPMVWVTHINQANWIQKLKNATLYSEGGQAWRHRFCRTVTINNGAPRAGGWFPNEVHRDVIPEFLPELYSTMDISKYQKILGVHKDEAWEYVPVIPEQVDEFRTLVLQGWRNRWEDFKTHDRMTPVKLAVFRKWFTMNVVAELRTENHDVGDQLALMPNRYLNVHTLFPKFALFEATYLTASYWSPGYLQFATNTQGINVLVMQSSITLAPADERTGAAWDEEVNWTAKANVILGEE